MKQYHNFVLIVLLILVAPIQLYRGRARYKQKKCEEISIPLCKDVGYNLTYMPNRFGHKTQFDAGLIIHQFLPLVLINCSPLLKHFVCSLYSPMCDPIYHKTVEPCRTFCEDVRDKCEPIMKVNGFAWPEHLKCSQFPTRDNNKICMKPNANLVKSTSNEENKTSTTKVPSETHIPNVPKIPIESKSSSKKSSSSTRKLQKNVYEEILNLNSHILPTRKTSGCYCMCKEPFVHPNVSQRMKEEIPPCALPCKKYFFDKNQLNFVSFWLSLWSIITLIASLTSFTTFMIERNRFLYTERPLIYISVCYIFVSFGYIIRIIYGHENISCNSETQLLRYSATGPAQCTAVFILIYFFTNVAWIWWVVLSINCFLSIGLKWSSTAISSYSQYFHFIAWLIPTVQTMAILAMSAIDGDPVSGLCSVGNHDNNTLTIFVIAPLSIYAMLSLSFFIAGVVAIYQNKKENHYYSKLGLFTLMLFIPACTLLGCYFYEHSSKELWEKSTNCPCISKQVTPKFGVFLLKYSMTLISGLIACFWLVETKTYDSWKKFLEKVCQLKLLSFGKENDNSNLIDHNHYTQHQQHLLLARDQPSQTFLLHHHLQNGAGEAVII